MDFGHARELNQLGNMVGANASAGNDRQCSTGPSRQPRNGVGSDHCARRSTRRQHAGHSDRAQHLESPFEFRGQVECTVEGEGQRPSGVDE
jgi:hypothetical protein